MPSHGTKIFQVILLIITFIIIGYLWFIFLPQFEGKVEYPSMRIIVLLVILLLILAAGAQIILLRRPPKYEEFNEFGQFDYKFYLNVTCSLL
ncbi:MAG: hypothetical protein QW502_00085 [Candidatus Bathyarchaeia archaeon]|nr:hypothetical protein [Candidatus Bathyarchaeota archaeon]